MARNLSSAPRRINYAKMDSDHRRHHERLQRRIAAMPRKLVCQACRGQGGEREIIDPEIGGPWFECGWCEGLGFVTPYLRGVWLRCQRQALATLRAKIPEQPK